MILDKETIRKLTIKANQVASSYGQEHLAEDFIQEMLIKYMNGRKGKVKQLFIDYLRSELGDNRRKNNVFKPAESLEWEDYMDMEVKDEHNLDYKNIINSVEGHKRTILVLYYEWGFTLNEIGHTLGISEGRVCQVFKDLNCNLSRRFGNV